MLRHPQHLVKFEERLQSRLNIQKSKVTDYMKDSARKPWSTMRNDCTLYTCYCGKSSKLYIFMHRVIKVPIKLIKLAELNSKKWDTQTHLSPPGKCVSQTHTLINPTSLVIMEGGKKEDKARILFKICAGVETEFYCNSHLQHPTPSILFIITVSVKSWILKRFGRTAFAISQPE